MHYGLFWFSLLRRTNVINNNLFHTSKFNYYRVNVGIEGISSCHTLLKMSFWVKVTVSKIMFEPPHLIPFIRQFIKLPDNIWNVLHTDICYCIPLLFAFICHALDLRPIDIINHFTDLTKLSFVSEDLARIFYRQPNFNNMSKVAYLSLPFIYICVS